MSKKNKERKEEYVFSHEWDINAPSEVVWNVMTDPAKWPGILYGVAKLDGLTDERLAEKDQLFEFVIKGILPYSLLFRVYIEKIMTDKYLDAKVSGDLEGYCEIILTPENQTTHLGFNMGVSLVKPWMKFLGPVAKKFFIKNHNFVVQKSFRSFEQQISLAMN